MTCIFGLSLAFVLVSQGASIVDSDYITSTVKDLRYVIGGLYGYSGLGIGLLPEWKYHLIPQSHGSKVIQDPDPAD